MSTLVFNLKGSEQYFTIVVSRAIEKPFRPIKRNLLRGKFGHGIVIWLVYFFLLERCDGN